ncbi:hypothetical protein ATK17_0092 [Branchiibius hedensis]|uniref:Uncharacterized protein n=1 Tax=Branchiibius hedensis TaxID=672460 RepID=A0A2Y8ZSC6_9MICO|nr:hypothetical protein [Branchiibius hedensis]PWJ24009.1 hypothetical protein ATK17_0092 [Branchiibius hedensis]SSA32827.1 hypothetical protein SAMN04489750_0092 [Branchiibius hedensis]
MLPVLASAAAWWVDLHGLAVAGLSALSPLAWAGLAGVCVAMWLIACGGDLRIAGWVLAAPLAVLALGYGFVAALGLFDERSEVRSPNSRYALIVQSGHAAIDPIWKLQLEQPGALISRRWPIGCVNGDYLNYSDAQWVSDSRVDIRIDGGAVPLLVNENGPVQPVDERLRSC